MIGLNFGSMNASKEYTLDELFPKTDTSTPFGSSGNADRIQTWDQENQCFRYFFLMKGGTVGPSAAKNNKWVEDISGSPLSTITLKTGDSVFFFSQKDQTLSIPGQVPEQASVTLKHGQNLVSVGFPAKWNPNNEGTAFWGDTTKFTPFGSSGNADRMQLWDKENEKYRFLFLMKGGTVGPSAAKNNKWVEDITGNPIFEEELDVSDGFFYYLQKSENVEFKPNLKLN